MVGVLLKHVSKHKMFTLQNELENLLKTRKLRYPATMDLTYGGNLP